MDDALQQFNEHMQQRAVAGGYAHEPLITIEKAAIKAWAWYMAERVEP